MTPWNRLHHSRWRPWKYNKNRRVLVLTNDGQPYEVELDSCKTSAQVLDWICQISRKSWATDAIIADLCRWLNEVVDPQATICSGGVERSSGMSSATPYHYNI